MILFGCLLLAALVFAAHAKDRIQAILAAQMLAFNWLICATSYSSTPPASILWEMGWPVDSLMLWSIADVLCVGVVCLLARDLWWGKALAIIFTGQCFMLAVYDAGGINFDRCSNILDAGFVLEAGVFLLIGGGGVADNLRDLLHRFRSVGYGPARALSKAAAR